MTDRERSNPPAAGARGAAKPPAPARSKQDELAWRQANRKRPDLIVLMGCTVIAVVVLVDIVRTHLATPVPTTAPRAERAASAHASPSPTSTTKILERVFESTLADLKKDQAANPEAQRQTTAYRSMLSGMIASAQLKLDIETFECGPSLCAGSLRGDAGAYDTLFGAIVDAPPLPIHNVVNYSLEREHERNDGPHRFIFSVNKGADEASAPKRPAAPP